MTERDENKGTTLSGSPSSTLPASDTTGKDGKGQAVPTATKPQDQPGKPGDPNGSGQPNSGQSKPQGGTPGNSTETQPSDRKEDKDADRDNTPDASRTTAKDTTGNGSQQSGAR